MKAIASKAKHGSLCLESQHSGGWGKKTVNWKPAWTISQDTVERKGRRGGRKRGKNNNLKTGLQEMNKVASGRLFLSSWSRISGFQTPLSPQRSSLTCPVCQREPKRKNLPPLQICFHFANFFLHFVLVDTGKPCSPATVLRPAVPLGKAPTPVLCKVQISFCRLDLV